MNFVKNVLAKSESIQLKKEKAAKRKWVHKFNQLSRQIKVEERQLKSFIENGRFSDVKHALVNSERGKEQRKVNYLSMRRSIDRIKGMVRRVEEHLRSENAGDAFVAELRKRINVTESALNKFKEAQRRKWEMNAQEGYDLEEDLENHTKRFASWDLRGWTKRRLERMPYEKSYHSSTKKGRTGEVLRGRPPVRSAIAPSDPLAAELRRIDQESDIDGGLTGHWHRQDHDLFMELLGKYQLRFSPPGAHHAEAAATLVESGVDDSGGGPLVNFFRDVCLQIPGQDISSALDHYNFYLRSRDRDIRKKELVNAWRTKRAKIQLAQQEKKREEEQKLLELQSNKTALSKNAEREKLEKKREEVKRWREERERKRRAEMESKKAVKERIKIEKEKIRLRELNESKQALKEYRRQQEEDKERRRHAARNVSAATMRRKLEQEYERKEAIRQRRIRDMELATKRGEERRYRAAEKENNEALWMREQKEKESKRGRMEGKEAQRIATRRLTRSTKASRGMQMSRTEFEERQKLRKMRSGGHNSKMHFAPVVGENRSSGIAVPSWRMGL
eukprot:g1037.t1